MLGYSTGLSTFSVVGGSGFGGSRLWISENVALVSGFYQEGRANKHEPRPPMIKLFLIQEFPPLVFRNFRTELCVLQQVEMVESVGVPDIDWK